MSTFEGREPTSASVRRVYSDALMGDGSVISLGQAWAEAGAEFDLWLDSVRADAWDEGFDSGYDRVMVERSVKPGAPDLRVNPYRSENN